MLSFIHQRRAQRNNTSKPSNRRRRMRVEWLEPRLLLSHNSNHNPGGGGGGGGEEPPVDPAIAFIIQRSEKSSKIDDLAVMNADGSNQTVLLQGESVKFQRFGYSSLDWSPDLDGDPTNGYQGTLAVTNRSQALGKHIVLVDVDLDGGVPTAQNVRVLVDGTDPGVVAAGDDGAGGPFWSPDLDSTTPGYQGEIAFNTAWSINVIGVEWDADSGTVNTTGTSQVLFAVDTTDGETDFVGSATWSPDGAQIAFVYRACRESCGNSTLLLIDRNDPNIPTPTTTEIIPEGMFYSFSFLEWGDPGLAFTGLDFDSSSQLYVLDPALGVSSLQALPAVGQHPSWSVDDPTTPVDESGQFLIFSTGDIHQLDLATTTDTLLADSGPKLSFSYPDLRPFASSVAAAMSAANEESNASSVITLPAPSTTEASSTGDAITSDASTLIASANPAPAADPDPLPQPTQTPGSHTINDRALVDLALSGPATLDEPLLGELATALAG